jgi:hypothetical protein
MVARADLLDCQIAGPPQEPARLLVGLIKILAADFSPIGRGEETERQCAASVHPWLPSDGRKAGSQALLERARTG